MIVSIERMIDCSKKSSIHEFTADRRPFRKTTSNAAIYEYKIYKKSEKVVTILIEFKVLRLKNIYKDEHIKRFF